MKIFAIGDLHLSKAVDKPMNVFGENWEGHDDKIFSYWKENVSDDDIVLLAGDISWGTKLGEARKDLDDISAMPGRKFLIKGNHDFWWTTATALNKLYDENMVFMNTRFEKIGKYALCATRGWACPNDISYEEKDFSIYRREANRLMISLEEARKAGYSDFIVMTHYPPTNENFDSSLFTEIAEKYKPKYFIYGHLHGEESFKHGMQGKIGETEYILVSSDYLDFRLKEIEDI